MVSLNFNGSMLRLYSAAISFSYHLMKITSRKIFPNGQNSDQYPIKPYNNIATNASAYTTGGTHDRKNYENSYTDINLTKTFLISAISEK